MLDKILLEKFNRFPREGKTKEEVYLSLLKDGWMVDDINDCFLALHYEEQEKNRKENLQKRTITIIATVGAVLIGAGIFSFVASNWQHMTKVIKVLILLVTMLTSYIAGWALKEKYNYEKLGESFMFLGLIVYGASIFLIAQMFNVRANWPDGLILWMFGSILLTLATDIFLFNYLTVILGSIAFIGHPFVIFGRYLSHDPFLLTSSFLLLMSTVVLFWVAFHVRKKVKKEVDEIY